MPVLSNDYMCTNTLIRLHSTCHLVKKSNIFFLNTLIGQFQPIAGQNSKFRKIRENEIETGVETNVHSFRTELTFVNIMDCFYDPRNEEVAAWMKDWVQKNDSFIGNCETGDRHFF